MKIPSVILLGVLGIIISFFDSEATQNETQEILSKYLPKIQCYVDQAPCNSEDAVFKSKIPEILVNNCLACDEKIRKGASIELSTLRQYFPAEFKKLLEKNSIKIALNCFLNDNLCNTKLTYFKNKLPFYLKYNECPDCTDEFIHIMQERIDYLKKFYPQEWQQIEQIYGQQ